MTTVRRSYDHRIRKQILLGNTALTRELGIPRSTAKSWVTRVNRDVAHLGEPVATRARLLARIAKLERRVAVLSDI
jgi:hypothetical protein